MRNVIIAAVAAVATCASGPAAAQQPIKIGAFLSSTGPISFLGDPEMKTLKLYVDRINKAGGVKGRPLELVAYDDAGDTSQARSFALRLVNQDKVVAIIGGSSTGTTMATIPVFEDNEIPLISLAGAITIVEPVKKWVFKTPATDRTAVLRGFEHMKTNGIAKIGMLNGSDGYGQSGREQALKAAKELGIEIVADEVYAPTDSDMTAQLTRIRNANAQAILNFGIGASPSIIARNVKQLSLNIPLYLSPAIASKTFLDNTGAAAEGVFVPVASLLVADKLPDSAPQKKVALDYKRTYEEAQKEPASYGGGAAYDGLMMLIGAIERTIDKGGKVTPEAIRDEIEKTKEFVGINGIFTMSPKDHLGLDSSAFIIAVVKNGDWHPTN
ncbi:ABC transporter substrate-binding protein [Tardiphaga robiniae]|uniref:ABC transporter substrate-binding protein n=1 Tax=Tardiphaga robiniae TaxID=943830 RepID=UPI001586D653|nr:ABC transporter substrate-binding protein [Tardiphaga robiniae]NUU42579.1 ABC transporter substrate-binding protein [Tardiphaga robiniae]